MQAAAGRSTGAQNGTSEENLDDAFFALASETRRAMLARLATGEATVNELSALFDISLPAVSKHVKVLEQAGLIERRRVAQSRPCRLSVERLDSVSDWLQSQRDVWDESFDRLDEHLASLKSQDKQNKDDK